MFSAVDLVPAQSQGKSLEGTWRLASVTFDGNQKAKKGMAVLKVVSKTHFTWTGFDEESRIVEICAGGKYSLKDNVLTEKYLFAAIPSGLFLEGKSECVFEYKVEGDKLYQSGKVREFRSEWIWVREE
jgi:hypothetical protein